MRKLTLSAASVMRKKKFMTLTPNVPFFLCFILSILVDAQVQGKMDREKKTDRKRRQKKET